MFGIFFEAIIQFVKPGWQRRAAQSCDTCQPLEVWLQHDARYNRDVDAKVTRGLQEGDIVVGVIEELRDGPVGAGVLFGLQDFKVLLKTKAVRVRFRIGCNRNLELLAEFGFVIPDRLDQFDRA